ncbi:MAG: tRNA (N(6)-L-threonylcarbamoyladenosine(37)-C(2))-methylthiotransferase MtaB [Desulfobacterales bacterium]|nr:MAG: tRNA (N(6)-L-threonylcarbamoyladenosine(37)-C(2))-methylthiotransferase MtaB [Desulfobacterales bacterium]
MKSFTIATLGCKVNRYESEAISEQLVDQGWLATDKGIVADLCIINTCTVTQKAAMQSRQTARKVIRNHPGALVVVTGCYAQISPEVFSTMPGVHCVVGNSFKNQIVLLANTRKRKASVFTLIQDLSTPRPFQDMSIKKFGNRTRAFLKIQDGCDAFCAYCIIPHARGRSRSLTPEVVIKRVGGLKEQGYAEVVLCGINLGRYGEDLKPTTSLLSLIRAIEGSPEIKRLRLSSIEPTELSEEFIGQLASSEHICPHLHIPLQSGDDGVLESMNRPYKSKHYRDLVNHITSVIPDVAIGVDILVGFPGESEKAFENTCCLIEQLPMAYLHVFPFSMQKQTPASSLRGVVPPKEIKRRCQQIRTIGETKRRGFYERAIGSILEVLIEGKRDRASGHLKGLTRNYIPVLLEGGDELMHRVIQTRLTKIEHGRVFGERVSGQ